MIVADKGPNYTVERKRLELTQMEHRQLIKKQSGRLEEIETQKAMNVSRTELANMELDAESESIRANQVALEAKIAEIDKNLTAMVK
jgi:predicted component of type VI protein secretion system